MSRVRKSDLEDTISECKSYLQSIESELIALGSYTLPVYDDGEEKCSIIDHARIRIPELLEEYSEEARKLFLATHALENPDEVTEDN